MAGDVKFDGDPGNLDELGSSRDTFQFWFNIETP